MRDVDARDPLARELTHEIEQRLHFQLAQRGGGLVEDQHARLPAYRLEDLDLLLPADAERSRRLVRGDVHTESAEQLACLAHQPRPVDERPA